MTIRTSSWKPPTISIELLDPREIPLIEFTMFEVMSDPEEDLEKSKAKKEAAKLEKTFKQHWGRFHSTIFIKIAALEK